MTSPGFLSRPWDQRTEPRRLLALLVVILATAGHAGADPAPPPGAERQPTPAAKYQALVQEYQTARKEFFERYARAQTEKEQHQLLTEKYPKPARFAARFLELAESCCDEPALDALGWILTNTEASSLETETLRNRAVDLLLRDHLQSPKLAVAFPGLENMPYPAAEKLLRAAIEKNPHREVQGHASFSLAQCLKNKADGARYLKQHPAFARELEQSGRKVLLKEFQQSDPDALVREAETVLQRVAAKYADVKEGDRTLGQAVESQLFELHQLAIGKVAPEIEGQDIEGRSLKLSDHRGKVTLLVYWGDW
jgi:hypothetical protein